MTQHRITFNSVDLVASWRWVCDKILGFWFWRERLRQTFKKLSQQFLRTCVHLHFGGNCINKYSFFILQFLYEPSNAVVQSEECGDRPNCAMCYDYCSMLYQEPKVVMKMMCSDFICVSLNILIIIVNMYFVINEFSKFKNHLLMTFSFNYSFLAANSRVITIDSSCPDHQRIKIYGSSQIWIYLSQCILTWILNLESCLTLSCKLNLRKWQKMHPVSKHNKLVNS